MTRSSEVAADCDYCANVLTHPSACLHHSGGWTLVGPPMLKEPGWFLVLVDRHVERLDDLTVTELATMGPVLAQVSRAIDQTVRPAKIYLAQFGEQQAHLHFLMVPRLESDQPSHRGPTLILNRGHYADPDRAADVASRVVGALTPPDSAQIRPTSPQPERKNHV